MKALDVAKYIITRCYEHGHPISNLQLQKILYFIQVAFLQRFDKPCFEDAIEAWKLGPVVRNVYNEYCYYGSLKILLEYPNAELYFFGDTKVLLDSVIDERSQKTARQLVQESHEPGRAWSRVYKNGEGLYELISNDYIKNYG